jgi:hypothetical protein
MFPVLRERSAATLNVAKSWTTAKFLQAKVDYAVRVAVLKARLRRLTSAAMIRAVYYEIAIQANTLKARAAIVKAASTIISIAVAVAFVLLFDGSTLKVSETHLTCAQIIGGALALVLCFP